MIVPYPCPLPTCTWFYRHVATPETTNVPTDIMSWTPLNWVEMSERTNSGLTAAQIIDAHLATHPPMRLLPRTRPRRCGCRRGVRLRRPQWCWPMRWAGVAAMSDSRILLAGDVHGNCSFVISLLDQARNHGCDRIVQVGDWGAWEHEPDGLKFVRDVEKHAAKRGIGIWWLDGNHDNTRLTLKLHPDRDDEGFHIVTDHVRYIPRGHRWTWNGVRFAAFGGAYSVDKEWRIEREQKRRKPGTLWFPEEQMTDAEFYRLLADPTSVDVLLSHDKPLGSRPDWNRKDLPGCLPNQERIQSAAMVLTPKLLVHGHLHYRYTDQIRVGGDWCRVEGLAADPDAMGYDYVKGESWMVLDLEKGLEGNGYAEA